MFTQNLDENITECKIQNGNGLVTFLTDPEIVRQKITGSQPRIGVVVWFPGDVFER